MHSWCESVNKIESWTQLEYIYLFKMLAVQIASKVKQINEISIFSQTVCCFIAYM